MDIETLEHLVSILLYGSVGIFILYMVIRFIVTEYRTNKIRKAPVHTMRSTVYYKHPETEWVNLGRHSTTIYFATFHTDLGESLKLYLTGEDFYRLQEGDVGELTWQDDKFWKFVPEKKED